VRWPVTRLLTALCVVALCAVAVSGGWKIVRFANARAAAPEHRADAVRPWTTVPGVASEALAASLSNMTDAADAAAARNRGDVLGAILEVRPLSSRTWLSLAGMRLVSGDAYEHTLAALAMSSLTGPNEGLVMLERGIFGLLQWELLPKEFRTRTITDLAGAISGSTVQDSAIAPAKGVLAVKPGDVRLEIAGLLRAQGLATNDLARLGL
jgi:hypothetical protein